MVKFIKNNLNPIFNDHFVLFIQDNNNPHHDNNDNNKNQNNILFNQKNKYDTPTNKRGVIKNVIIKFFDSIDFVSEKSNNSLILNFNKNGIIKKIPANIHINELNSNHQYI